jgi:hypothetical protein
MGKHIQIFGKIVFVIKGDKNMFVNIDVNDHANDAIMLTSHITFFFLPTLFCSPSYALELDLMHVLGL